MHRCHNTNYLFYLKPPITQRVTNNREADENCHIYRLIYKSNRKHLPLFSFLQWGMVSCVTLWRASEAAQQLFHVSPLRPLSGCRWFQLKYFSLNAVKPAFSAEEMHTINTWCHREHKDPQCVYLLLIKCFWNTFEPYPPTIMVLGFLTKSALLCLRGQVGRLCLMPNRCGI